VGFAGQAPGDALDTTFKGRMDMTRIGIIISNHEAEEWTEKKLKEEYHLDEVRYFKHPEIDPRATKGKVWTLACNFVLNEILDTEWGRNVVVASVNGEYGYSTACVFFLKKFLIVSKPVCVYPTSERGATEEKQADGSIKTVHVYKFVQFREW
jgi:hypothetical protein